MGNGTWLLIDRDSFPIFSYNKKLRVMNTQLVQDAVRLFMETEKMDSLDVNDPVQAKEFEELYQKECELFDLIGKMTKDELALYKSDVEGLQFEMQFDFL
jgi:hypothetical protein